MGVMISIVPHGEPQSGDRRVEIELHEPCTIADMLAAEAAKEQAEDDGMGLVSFTKTPTRARWVYID